MDLKGKRIVVTGAATGIGRATAIRVAKEGARVAALDINDAEARKTLATIGEAGGKAKYWHVNVTDEVQVKGSIAEAVEWLGGGPDVLIHLAGVLQGPSVDITDFTEATWDTVLDINLKGSFLVSKHVAGYMLGTSSATGGAAGSTGGVPGSEGHAGGTTGGGAGGTAGGTSHGADGSAAGDRRGVIILTSSGAGVTGGSSSFAYGSSKGGVHGLSMVMAANLGPKGIRVNDVAPGALATPLKIGQVEESFRKTGDRVSYERAMKGLMPPEGVASVMAWLASDDADYVRGTIFTK